MNKRAAVTLVACVLSWLSTPAVVAQSNSPRERALDRIYASSDASSDRRSGEQIAKMQAKAIVIAGAVIGVGAGTELYFGLRGRKQHDE